MRKLTETSLRRAAEHHVERHPVTEKRLVDVLRRKVLAHTRKTGEPAPADVETWIAKIASDLVRTGLVDDRRLAESRTRTLRARGKSTRAVRESLRLKGVSKELAEDVLAAPGDDGSHRATEAVDEESAWRLAKRKRLGPYRSPDARAEHRTKDLAALGRAGFSFAIARRIVDGEPPE
ncbi:MAG: regulatory protein RecX [Polyangiales bacterium]